MEVTQERREGVSSLVKMAEMLSSQQKDNAPPIDTGKAIVAPISLSEEGIPTREDIMKDLAIPVDRYGRIRMSRQQEDKLKRSLRRQTYGAFSASPMICNGDTCPVNKTCDFYQAGAAPVGETCLIEENLIEYWMNRYLDEFHVDPASLVEMHLISELVEITLQDSRATKYLAIYAPMMTEEYVIGIDANGMEITSRQVSKAFDIKERLKRQKMKILESLVATRERKIKIVSVAGNTAATISISDIKEKLDRLLRKSSNDFNVVDGEIM
jgi:hypothetical protein